MNGKIAVLSLVFSFFYVSLFAFNVDAGNDTTINEGDSVTIGSSPTASGGQAPYTYSWTPATGLSSASVANPKASPHDTTTYTVTVRDADGFVCSDEVKV